MTDIWICITLPFSHNNYSIKFDNSVDWQTFSVTNNAVLSEFNWKGMNLKGGNKRPFKDLKICKAVKVKHEMSMLLPVGWIKLH